MKIWSVVFLAVGLGCGTRDGLDQAGIDAGRVEAGIPKSCSLDSECSSLEFCLGGICLNRCGPPPAANMVDNAGFDQTIWQDSDIDRGYGSVEPRWDAEDSLRCPSSGSLAVTDRTAFSNLIPLGPSGTRYYWGFWVKGFQTDPRQHPACNLRFCTDATCGYFLSGDPLYPTVPALDWQRIEFWTTIPDPVAGAAFPFLRIACDSPDHQASLFDRFYFSTAPVPY